MDKLEIIKDAKYSPSEEHGLSLLSENMSNVYCPGVSTGGAAEARMALSHSGRKIISTTLDENGFAELKKSIGEMGLAGQVIIKLEDVSKPLPYPDNHFDFVYARLILHYLDKDALNVALEELHRALKPEGLIYVVVRSVDDPDIRTEGTTYDQKTGMHTYPFIDENGKIDSAKPTKRYFHTQQSITNHLNKAGFTISHIDQYDEQLYLDFAREKKSSRVANLVEVVAIK